MLVNPSEDSIQEEAEAYEKWLHVAGLEEDILKQIAKIHWLDVGDQNNKTFYNAIRTRQAQNTIREIRCQNGITVTSHLDIKNEAESFFSEFLNLNPPEYQGTSKEELQELLEFRCSVEDCTMLEAEVTKEEIRKVFFAMPANKSTGLDEFSSEFFKTTWSVLAHDFTVAI